MEQQNPVHAKFHDFVKSEDGSEKVAQYMFENTDRDVLIGSNNGKIPSNITRLSDLVSQLSAYAFQPENTKLVEKYAGNGTPPEDLKVSAGDRYVDLDTGHIYEYRGLNELQGYQKIPLIDKYICTQMDSTVQTHWDSDAIHNMIDDDLETVGQVRRKRRIVFDLGKVVDIGKISLSFNNQPGFYKYTYVASSTNPPSSYVVGQNHGMTWTDIAAGYGTINGISGITVESNSITTDGTGTVNFVVSKGSHKARYISIWSPSNDINVANFEIYAHPREDAVPTRWVMISEEGPKIDVDTMIRFGTALAPEQTSIGSICFVPNVNNRITGIIHKTGETSSTTYSLEQDVLGTEVTIDDMTMSLQEYLEALSQVVGDISLTLSDKNSYGLTYWNVRQKVADALTISNIEWLQTVPYIIGAGFYGIRSNGFNFDVTYLQKGGKDIATEDFVQSEISKISIPDLTNYATKSYVNTQIGNIDLSGYATQSSLDNYMPKSGGTFTSFIKINDGNVVIGTDQYGIIAKTPVNDSDLVITDGSGSYFGSLMGYGGYTINPKYYSNFGCNLTSDIPMDNTFGKNYSTVAMNNEFGINFSSGNLNNTFGCAANGSSGNVTNEFGVNYIQNSNLKMTNYFGKAVPNSSYRGSVSNYYGYYAGNNYFGNQALYNYFGGGNLTSSLIVENNFGNIVSPSIIKGGRITVGDSESRPVYLQGTANKVVGTTSGYNTKIHFSETEPTNMAVGDVWFKLASTS